jgi:hypothetical protein
MILDIKNIQNNSAESELINHYYSELQLTVNLRLNELESLVKIIIPTHQIFCQVDYQKQPSICRVCYIDIVDPLQKLTVNSNGIIIPAGNFSILMKELREGFGVTYGIHVNKKPKIIRFVGSIPFISCVTCDFDKIICVSD